MPSATDRVIHLRCIAFSLGRICSGEPSGQGSIGEEQVARRTYERAHQASTDLSVREEATSRTYERAHQVSVDLSARKKATRRTYERAHQAGIDLSARKKATRRTYERAHQASIDLSARNNVARRRRDVLRSPVVPIGQTQDTKILELRINSYKCLALASTLALPSFDKKK